MNVSYIKWFDKFSYETKLYLANKYLKSLAVPVSEYDIKLLYNKIMGLALSHWNPLSNKGLLCFKYFGNYNYIRLENQDILSIYIFSNIEDFCDPDDEVMNSIGKKIKELSGSSIGSERIRIKLEICKLIGNLSMYKNYAI